MSSSKPCPACGKSFITLSKHVSKCSKRHQQNSELLASFAQVTKKAKVEHVAFVPGGTHNPISSTISDPGPSEAQITEGESVMVSPESRQPSPMQDLVEDSELPPTRSGRRRTFPGRYVDYLPTSTIESEISEPSESPDTDVPSQNVTRTEINCFGVYREYPTSILPGHIPDADIELGEVCDSPGLETAQSLSSPDPPRWWKGFGTHSAADSLQRKVLAPMLSSPTVVRLLSWLYNGNTMKSAADLDTLVHHVLLADDFQPSDLEKFTTSGALSQLDSLDGIAPPDSAGSTSSSDDPHLNAQTPFHRENGWSTSSVKIRLPCEQVSFNTEDHAPEYEVPGVRHRSLTETIQTALQDSNAESFHYTPFKEYWKPTHDSSPERIYSEVYNSDVFLEEHQKLQQQQRESGCNLERSIAALMIWSDSTHLADFGTASLWPIYFFLGNQSKYSRGKPSNFSAHHVAYMPKVPDNIQDKYWAIFGEAASESTLTHLKRELIHAIWLLLMDEEFMDAYEHGMVVKCADGVTRRIYPRFFTYSADYPEKTLIATIKFLGRCPCPRCLIKKDDIANLGTKTDRQIRNVRVRYDNPSRQKKIITARNRIFRAGRKVNGTAVEKGLKLHSLVPTKNAFSERLSRFRFNFFRMMAPDQLHEFESGVWKAVFTHLLRLLYAMGGDLIPELNRRYRDIPTFGNGVIRRFSNNASGMKKLAARDFENLLKCSIPVFAGLFPEEHNERVITLLFTLCSWHSLAKLRVHTEATLKTLDQVTTDLGNLLRDFANTICTEYVTRELPQEEAARGRRQAAAAAKKQEHPPTDEPPSEPATVTKPGRRQKVFNLSTYKLHALGDYVSYIKLFGTSDNYSTQTGELEHRRIKKFYKRTNKQANFTQQISNHQRRERLLRKMTAQLGPSTSSKAAIKRRSRPKSSTAAENSERLPSVAPEMHHQMGSSQRLHEVLPLWLATHDGDPAVKDFLPELKDHLLCRLLGLEFDGDELWHFSALDRNELRILNHKFYRHNRLRVNYTTYDMRRAQDTISIRAHPDVMVLSRETNEDGTVSHPYWYARVIGIFHVNVMFSGRASKIQRDWSQPQRMEILWVRWFARLDTHNHTTGLQEKMLPRVGFVRKEDDTPMFGFLDPSQVIRGAHIVPAFEYGQTKELLGPSIARLPADADIDWEVFYVDIFADRDMMMRFHGGGIGHKYLHMMQALSTQSDDLDNTTNNAGAGDEDGSDSDLDHDDHLDSPGEEAIEDYNTDDDNNGDSTEDEGEQDIENDGDEDEEQEYEMDELEEYGYAPY